MHAEIAMQLVALDRQLSEADDALPQTPHATAEALKKSV